MDNKIFLLLIFINILINHHYYKMLFTLFKISKLKNNYLFIRGQTFPTYFIMNIYDDNHYQCIFYIMLSSS